MEITLGNLIDQLSIVNIRIWMLEDICRDPNATDKQIVDAKRKINICNQMRTDFISAIDKSKQGEIKMYGSKLTPWIEFKKKRKK